MITFNGPYHIGSMRWNGNTRQMEVMDQYGNWTSLYLSESNPPLPPDIAELLDWARKEIRRQQEMRALRDKYPTLDQALTHAEVITALVTEGG